MLVIMKEQARITNNGSLGLGSRQRQCCGNYSANSALLHRVCVCVLACGSGPEGIALFAAVSEELANCKKKMCVCRAFRMILKRKTLTRFQPVVLHDCDYCLKEST